MPDRTTILWKISVPLLCLALGATAGYGMYLAALRAKRAPRTSPEAFMQSVVRDGERLIVFDPTRRTRQPRSVEPGKDDLEVAKSLLEQNKKQLKVTLAKLKETTGQDVVFVSVVALEVVSGAVPSLAASVVVLAQRDHEPVALPLSHADSGSGVVELCRASWVAHPAAHPAAKISYGVFPLLEVHIAALSTMRLEASMERQTSMRA